MRGNVVAIRWCLLLAPMVAACAVITSCNRQPDPLVKPDAKAEVPVGPPFFEDVTEASGVKHTCRNGEEAGHYAILETLGGGVALFDFDGDGLLDIFVTGGGGFEGPDKKTITGLPCHLYRNLGGMKFQDVTKEVGLDGPLFYTQGCAVADYDRDGWPDLLVTGWGRVALYHNEPVDPKDPAKGRRFVEVSRQAGLTDNLWSTSAAWADLDGDGFPDLYICHYVDWSFDNHRRCGGYSVGVDRDVCPPKEFQGLPHILYRNNGNGTFTKTTQGDPVQDSGYHVRRLRDMDVRDVQLGIHVCRTSSAAGTCNNFRSQAQASSMSAATTGSREAYLRNPWFMPAAHFATTGTPAASRRCANASPSLRNTSHSATST